VIVAAVVVVVVVGGWLALRPASSKARPELAPAISGPIVNGGRFDLSAQRGHWVLVNFFASWCSACKVELPQLAELDSRHPDGLQVVSVDSLDDSLGSAERMIRSTKTEWPLVSDPDATTDYGVVGLPESFLVNPSGLIEARIFGGVTVSKVEGQLGAAKR